MQKILLAVALVAGLVTTIAAQNLRFTPVVKPTQGGSTQVGNFKLDYTIGEPAQKTLRNGNLVFTEGFEQNEKPLAPTAPTSQTVCSDTAVTFVFTGRIAGHGADQVEWAYDSAFTYSTYCSTDSVLKIQVQPNQKDTIWLRSRVSSSKLVSDSIVYVVLTVNFKPQPPTPPAPISVSSDTAYTFHFTNLRPGFGGNQLEWTLDSAFATSWFMTCYDTTIAGKDTSDCTITLTVPADSSALLWVRCIDTVSGCVSDPRSSIAIVADVYQRQPINVDTIINVCKGYNTYITIPNSVDTLRYDLLADTGRVAYAYGNDTALLINSGNIYTPTFFTVFVTDTLTGDTATLGGSILVNPIGAVDTNVYFDGDTLVYIGDTIYYEAGAHNGMTVVYSIPDSNATVNSTTGCVYNITDTIFTLRATIYGLAGCGSVYKDLLVHTTDVAPPVAPAPKTLIVDTDMVVTITFDSIQMGAGGDRIQWATHEDFSDIHTILPYGSISIALEPGMDTTIWLRTISRVTGKKSKAVTTEARSTYPIISAGLLDKSKWKIKYGEEFTAYENGGVQSTDFTDNWALNYCWENNCSATSCVNHALWSEKNPVDNSISRGYANINNDGSAGEVTISNGKAIFTATAITPFTTDCQSNGRYYYDHQFNYRTGHITSRTQKVDVSKPGILEVRAKMPAEHGVWPALWVFGSAEYDIMENSEGKNKATFNVHDWKQKDITGMLHRVCGRTFEKQTPCDFSQDFHTYSMVFSTEKLVFFVDGKETWSIDRTNGSPFPSDAALNESTAMPIMLGIGVREDATDNSYVMEVEYIRYYTPSDGTNDLPQSLLNVHSGIPRTLESLNANGQQSSPNNCLLPIINTFERKTHDIGLSKIAYTNEAGSQKIYYRGFNFDRKCYNAYLHAGQWYEYPLVYWINDVKGGITVDGDRVYYYSTDFEIKFFQWVGNEWANFNTGVYTNGSFTVDHLGRLFYIGRNDGNVWAWCPTDDTHGTAIQVTSDGNAVWNLSVHSCGCLLFYEDNNHNLRQQSWWNNWRNQNIVVDHSIAQLTASMALDETHSKVYFPDWSSHMNSYTWDYNSKNTNGFKKLGDICAAFDNAEGYTTNSSGVGLVPYENPQAFITLNNDNSMIYFLGYDNNIWYYFNDNDPQTDGGNWNKTPLDYFGAGTSYNSQRPVSNGLMAFEPGEEGKFFYVGMDKKMHYVSWLDADNPITCVGLGDYGTANSYKTDEESTTTGIVTSMQDSIFVVSVYPNPSDNLFNFSIKPVTQAPFTLDVFDVNGHSIFRETYEVSRAVLNTETFANGVYYYKIRTRTGVVSGKLLKFK